MGLKAMTSTPPGPCARKHQLSHAASGFGLWQQEEGDFGDGLKGKYITVGYSVLE